MYDARNLHCHAPSKWSVFKSYNKRDVEAEIEIHNRLIKYPVPDFVWDEYHLDQVINDRGINLLSYRGKSIRACLGGTEGSLLNQWGGEFEWDNFDIIHHQKRGANNGIVIEYGKNLTKFEQDSDVSEVYTDLFPYAISKDDEGNESIITLTEGVIPISTTLSNRKNLIKDFTDSFSEGEKVDEENLREKANKYLEVNPLGVETPTINISFEALWKQPDYVAILERVSLCDIVTVRHTELGVSVKTKVIKTTYDTLLEKYTSITLGSSKANLVDKVSNINNEIKDTKKSVDRLPNIIKTAVSTATKTITGNSGGYVILHSAKDGTPYELLIMDTDNIETAVNVWRWNVSGLGFSKNGYNGPYETAITSDGQIVADFITSGTLMANIIKAGVISSKDGTYAIFSRTQRIDDCIMGLKSNAYGENFWVEFKPEGYCTCRSSDSEDAELTGKIPYGSMNRICWLHSPLGSSYEGSNATCPQIIVFNYTVAKSSYSTIDLTVYDINEIIGASLTEKDTPSTGSNNQWFSIDKKKITIHNTTGGSKTYSVIVIAV